MHPKTEGFNRFAQTIETERFNNPEFRKFIKLRLQIDHGEYQNLSRCIDLLIAGLEARESYLCLGRTEFEYQGKYHQEYYKHSNSLILERVSRSIFLENITARFEELEAEIKTKTGLEKLRFYWTTLRGIAAHDLQYRILHSFKINKNIHYPILQELNDIILNTKPADILNPENLNKYIIDHLEVFNKIGRLITLPQQWRSVEVYNVILQYAIFKVKFKENVFRYHVFLTRLKNIKPVYEKIEQYRKEYTKLGYTLNLKLIRPIPGVHIYKKYKPYI